MEIFSLLISTIFLLSILAIPVLIVVLLIRIIRRLKQGVLFFVKSVKYETNLQVMKQIYKSMKQICKFVISF